MDHNRTELNQALAERQRLTGESEKHRERDRAAREQIANAEREISEAKTLVAQYNLEVAEAVAAGNAAPEPPTSLRTAAAKIAAGEAKIAALHGAIQHLERQNALVAEQAAAIEAQIKVERAKLLRPALREHQARQARATDEAAIADGVAGKLKGAIFDADPRTAGTAMSELEQDRLDWLATRDGRIATEIARRTAEILAKIPS